MTNAAQKIDVYLEIGKKRTFAVAIEWPGWARSGRDEPLALQSLCDYGLRYEHVLHGKNFGFHAPADVSEFNVIERLEGNATTDFGAPDIPHSSDASPVDEVALKRYLTLLHACWWAFEVAYHTAEGKQLLKGPRGGGRDQEKIALHVLNAEAAYLARLGWKHKLGVGTRLSEKFNLTWQAIQAALTASVSGSLPDRGPRGGVRWTPRYYVRRAAWHVLDHAWEIEDRIIS